MIIINNIIISNRINSKKGDRKIKNSLYLFLILHILVCTLSLDDLNRYDLH
jgi:hypothetical protein